MLLPNIQPHPATAGINPDLWTDADDEDRRTISIGDQISNLRNKWVGFNDFSQASAPLQPEYESNGINGLGSVAKIDSPSLEKLNSLNLIASAPPNFFLQFVWRYTGTLAGTDGYIFTIIFSGGGTVQYLLTINIVTQQIWSRPWWQPVGTVGGITSSLTLNQNQAYIIEILYDQTSSLHSLTLNGIFQGSSSTMITTIIDRFHIYTNHPTLSAPQSQEGTLFFNQTIPSALQIQRNRRYLANRYNISI